MPTPNLNITHVAPTQNQKTVTINDGFDLLDQAANSHLDLDVSAGGIFTLTAAQFNEIAIANLLGAAGSAVTINLPTNARGFYGFRNNSGQAATIQVTGGLGTSAALPAGEAVVIASTGTDVITFAGAAAPVGGGATEVILKSEDAVIASTVKTIDFGPDFTVVDEGGNEVLVTYAPPAIILPIELQYALGDQLNPQATPTTDILTVRAPRAILVTEVRLSLQTGSTTGTFTVDIKVGGVSILDTPLTVDAGELTSTTATTAAVLNVNANMADDAEITFDITDIADGSAIGPLVTLLGSRS